MLVCSRDGDSASGDASLIAADGTDASARIRESAQWLGFYGSLPCCSRSARSRGMFAVPLQVFMQCRPPDDKKGRMIAVDESGQLDRRSISAGLYKRCAWLLETYRLAAQPDVSVHRAADAAGRDLLPPEERAAGRRTRLTQPRASIEPISRPLLAALRSAASTRRSFSDEFLN